MRVIASEQIRDQYTTDYFLGGVGADGKPYGVAGYREFAAGTIDPWKGQMAGMLPYRGRTVLDVGCGRGDMIKFVLEHGATFAVGIDFAPAAIDIGCRFLRDVGLRDKADMRLLEMHNLWQLDDRYRFGAVYMVDIIEHVRDWEVFAFLAQLQERLTPDAELLAVTPAPPYCGDFRDMHNNYQTFESLMRLFEPFWGKVIIEQNGPIVNNRRYGGDYVVLASKPLAARSR